MNYGYSSPSGTGNLTKQVSQFGKTCVADNAAEFASRIRGSTRKVKANAAERGRFGSQKKEVGQRLISAQAIDMKW
jgi:hypothetical protein